MTGDHEAQFRAMYVEHVGAVLGYALRRVSAPEDAADVVAETFLVAWRRHRAVPPGDEARLWLFGVARRVLANHHRGERRRRDLGGRLRLQLAGTATAPDHGDSVAADAAVDAALASLRATDREVLTLALWEDLEPHEIATVLGTSAGTVRTRLSRARARLRAELGDAHPLHASTLPKGAS